jgi:acetoin utilization deacetylase AcuC-like enzyme
MAESVCDGRILFVQEGGYSMQGIRECGLRVMQELCGIETLKPDKLVKIKSARSSRTLLKKPIEVYRKYWDLPDR